jgi:tRNA (adenine57-N1/adenine58-N1)-methyltransferase catalytic subunit
MVEIAARKIEVRRDRIGLQEEGLRGVNASAASVEEAVSRLRDIEKRVLQPDGEEYISRTQRLAKIQEAQSTRKVYLEGNLTHRPELEFKLHTSYLLFAVLPMEWKEDDEIKAQQVIHETIKKGKGKKQMKRENKADSKDLVTE